MSWLIGCSGDEPIEPTTEWVRRTFKATERFATGGVYVNALDLGRSVREAYADDVWERLVEVKRRYDPTACSTRTGSVASSAYAAASVRLRTPSLASTRLT